MDGDRGLFPMPRRWVRFAIRDSGFLLPGVVDHPCYHLGKFFGRDGGFELEVRDGVAVKIAGFLDLPESSISIGFEGDRRFDTPAHHTGQGFRRFWLAFRIAIVLLLGSLAQMNLENFIQHGFQWVAVATIQNPF